MNSRNASKDTVLSKDRVASDMAPNPHRPAAGEKTLATLMAMLDEDQVIEAIEQVDADRQNAIRPRPPEQRVAKPK